MNQLQNLGIGKGPSKKLFAILATVILAAVGFGVYAYYTYGANDAPPYLKMDTSSLMQGKLSTMKGFAELKTKDGYSCDGTEGTLDGNVNNVFAMKPVTMKEVAESLKFDKKDGQYLVAFFSPGDDKAGKGFDKAGWYFYPTANSPYDTGDYAEFNIADDKGGDYTIPAFRGFQIIVNNAETKMCGKNLKLATDKKIFEGWDDSDLVKLYKDGFQYWPEGWVMIPMGIDFANGLVEMREEGSSFGLEIGSIYIQTDRATFVKDFNNDSKTNYVMIWVKVEKAFDWAAFVDKVTNARCIVDDPDYPDINGNYKVGESYTDPETKVVYVCGADMSSPTGGKFIVQVIEEKEEKDVKIKLDNLKLYYDGKILKGNFDVTNIGVSNVEKSTLKIKVMDNALGYVGFYESTDFGVAAGASVSLKDIAFDLEAAYEDKIVNGNVSVDVYVNNLFATSVNTTVDLSGYLPDPELQHEGLSVNPVLNQDDYSEVTLYFNNDIINYDVLPWKDKLVVADISNGVSVGLLNVTVVSPKEVKITFVEDLLPGHTYNFNTESWVSDIYESPLADFKLTIPAEIISEIIPYEMYFQPVFGDDIYIWVSIFLDESIGGGDFDYDADDSSEDAYLADSFKLDFMGRQLRPVMVFSCDSNSNCDFNDAGTINTVFAVGDLYDDLPYDTYLSLNDDSNVKFGITGLEFDGLDGEKYVIDDVYENIHYKTRLTNGVYDPVSKFITATFDDNLTSEYVSLCYFPDGDMDAHRCLQSDVSSQSKVDFATEVELPSGDYNAISFNGPFYLGLIEFTVFNPVPNNDGFSGVADRSYNIDDIILDRDFMKTVVSPDFSKFIGR